VQQAYAATVVGQVRLITALNAEIDTLEEVVAEHFGRQRDAEIYLSQPGLGPVLSARVLAEFGDDPDRFADAKSRKNYAGTSPITRASGTRRIVLARYARNCLAREADGGLGPGSGLGRAAGLFAERTGAEPGAVADRMVTGGLCWQRFLSIVRRVYLGPATTAVPRKVLPDPRHRRARLPAGRPAPRSLA
jgi:Transposase IS116/IS110/IS902 family